VAIYGTGLGPAAGVGSTFDSSAALPVSSVGVSVAISGLAAPLYYVSSGQVNVQIPYELDGQQQASVSVSYNGATSRGKEFKSLRGHPDYIRSSSIRMARQTRPVIRRQPAASSFCFATGLGVTSPPSVTGKAAVAPYPGPASPVRVLIDGKMARFCSRGWPLALLA